MDRFKETRALLQYPHFVYFKEKFTGATWRPWCQDLISLNLLSGTKTTLKVKPLRTLHGCSIIGGKVFLFGDREGIVLANLSTGNVLAQVPGYLKTVEAMSFGKVDSYHLCYLRRDQKLFELRSGSALFS